jgi:hypothetical protein
LQARKIIVSSKLDASERKKVLIGSACYTDGIGAGIRVFIVCYSSVPEDYLVVVLPVKPGSSRLANLEVAFVLGVTGTPGCDDIVKNIHEPEQ